MVSVLFHFQFEAGDFQQKYGNKLDILARKIIFHCFGLRQPKVRTSDPDSDSSQSIEKALIVVKF